MMSTDLVVADNNGQFTPERYNQMRRAIAACVSIDDCLKAQSVAAAMATYYHQIHDTEATQLLDEIRLRAWRRMSEIIARVDVSKCPTQKKMAEKVRAELGTDATAMLSDSRIIQLIKLAGVPERNFETEVQKASGSIDRLLYKAHPDKIKERENAERQRQKWEAEAPQREKADREAREKAEEKDAAETAKRAEAVIRMVKDQAIIEAPEVGLTLEAKARANLVEFKVMMDRKIHDQLRDAAHARRTTMWAILREAANYWFVVNGFEKV